MLPLLLDKLVIFTTGSGDEETAARAMRQGVRDYLIKDPDRRYLTLLPHRIEIALRQWQAEQRLRESEERHRDLIENATDLVQVVDADGIVQFVNRSWLKTLGYKESEVVGRSIFEFVTPAGREQGMELFRRVLAGETVSGFQMVFVAKDGRAIHVEGNLNCRFELNQPAATRGIFHDVTERKLHEAEREQLISELRAALEELKTLSGLLPVCAWCKKVRDDRGYWRDLEAYLGTRVRITHGICPACSQGFGASLPDAAAAPE